jgi:hypothetical protein
MPYQVFLLTIKTSVSTFFISKNSYFKVNFRVLYSNGGGFPLFEPEVVPLLHYAVRDMTYFLIEPEFEQKTEIEFELEVAETNLFPINLLLKICGNTFYLIYLLLSFTGKLNIFSSNPSFKSFILYFISILLKPMFFLMRA